MPRKRLTHQRKSKEATCKPKEYVAMRYLEKLPRNGNLQRQQLHIFEDANSSASTIPCWLERFTVGSQHVNHLMGSLDNLPRLMLMNSLNPSPQNIMSNFKKPWVDMVVIPILLSGMFLDIPNSLAKKFPSAGDHFKYLS